MSHGAKPFSMDDNLMHISYESGVLEDPRASAPEEMFRMTKGPGERKQTPDRVVRGAAPLAAAAGMTLQHRAGD